MPTISLKDIAYIRQADQWTPDLGAKLAELLQSFHTGLTNMAQQTNSNPDGPPDPPPTINSLKVNASNGQFSAEINHDGANVYRGVNYFLVHADNPAFTNPHVVDMGTSRNWASGNWGNAQRYFAAYASYPGSKPTPMVYHGTQGQPTLVQGGGNSPGPQFGTSQGSGTGSAGVAHSGFGPVPWRSPNGAPPTR